MAVFPKPKVKPPEPTAQPDALQPAQQSQGFTLPPDHVPGIAVPQGGSMCANCKYLAENQTDCTEPNFIQWNGGPQIPGAIDSYCSDWYEPRPELMEGSPEEEMGETPQGEATEQMAGDELRDGA